MKCVGLRFANVFSEIKQAWAIFTHLKLWVAVARRNSKWVKMYIRWLGKQRVNSQLTLTDNLFGYGSLVLRAIGPTGHWSYVQTIGPMGHWSYGPLVLRAIGPTACDRTLIFSSSGL